MSLYGGDLTTPQRVVNWMANGPTLPSTIISQLIPSMTGLIYGKLNRARVYSQTITRTFDGAGNMQLVLPDYPVTGITSVQVGQTIVPSSLLSTASNPCYGYRFIPWSGDLPGENTVLEFRGGYFCMGVQNVRVTYTAGYLIQSEAQVVPASLGPYTVTVTQPQGIWSRDNGVVYSNGIPLTPVKILTTVGQYIAPSDANPGLYTFYSGDANAAVLISYSFIPAVLEEACIQMIAERYGYRTRIGEISKSLGGQETVRFMRGGTARPYGTTSLPPEVMDLIADYVSVVPPLIGAPV